ncbi:MAG: hypothetical protein AAF916_13050, partial [Planctomycetota bacterium]
PADAAGAAEAMHGVPMHALDEANLAASHAAHAEAVDAWAQTPGVEVLRLDVSAAGAMAALAEFVGVALPAGGSAEASFPHENAAGAVGGWFRKCKARLTRGIAH